MKLYAYLELLNPTIEDLNKFGAQGWELVSVLAYETPHAFGRRIAYLKRSSLMERV